MKLLRLDQLADPYPGPATAGDVRTVVVLEDPVGREISFDVQSYYDTGNFTVFVHAPEHVVYPLGDKNSDGDGTMVTGRVRGEQS
jgi:hypothetical protein